MTPSPRLLLAVAAGGAVGGVLRYGVGLAFDTSDATLWATFAVNVVGSALLAGLLLTPLARRSTTWAAGLGPGALGGFTTFSAASEQTRGLLASDRPLTAVVYTGGTLVACVAAATIMGRLAPTLPEEDER